MLLTACRRRADFERAVVDVFSGTAFLWAEAACLVLRLSGKPYVLALHGGGLPEFSRRWPRRVRRLILSATAVTAPSMYLPEHLGLSNDTYRVIPNPLSVARYAHRVRKPVRPRLIWLRAFHKVYNPLLAIRVLAGIVATHRDATLIMVGPDKKDGTFESAQALVKDLGLGARVRFAGAIPKTSVPEVLQQADILLNTSNIDNTPVSVLEALASGLCVVSTNVGGIPYLLRNNIDSLLVPANDPESMTRAVSRLLNEPELAPALSLNARKKALDSDWSAVLPRWEALLTHIG
jgi:glycosyltransferase involved in cell wall biosynthesis